MLKDITVEEVVSTILDTLNKNPLLESTSARTLSMGTLVNSKTKDLFQIQVSLVRDKAQFIDIGHVLDSVAIPIEQSIIGKG